MPNDSIAIAICATKNYAYAMGTQARRVVANLTGVSPGHLIISSDNSQEVKTVLELYSRILPEGWRIHHINNPHLNDENESYKLAAQMVISQLRSEAFSLARKLDVMACWSLDSDVLPPPNALRCMGSMLEFDAGYYGVSSCPYPNSAFLGGRGTPQNPICEDFLPNERRLPDDLKKEWETHDAEFSLKFGTASPETRDFLLKTRTELMKRIRDCPPDGNIWEVIGKYGWRRRGWLDNAYPAIGKGAVLPSDWCGFGCTLLGREALDLAHFDGYDGAGTEDLYICWKRWYPAAVRINVITHCLCDHVIWEKKKGGSPDKYTLHETYHETDGEYVGHIRVNQRPVTVQGGFVTPVPAPPAE